jgi:chromosome partitioning protein
MRRAWDEGDAQIVFVGNHKGGVGKTTNCVHIAAALGARGKRCLVWDLDANQGATLHFGVDGDRFLGTYEVLSGAEPARDLVITESDDVDLPRNVHLLPAGRNVDGIRRDRSRVSLEGPLRELGPSYDYILLDTSPNLTPATSAAYLAARWFIFSIFADPFAVVGLKSAIDNLHSAVRHGNREAALLGVVVSAVTQATLFRSRPKIETELMEYVTDRVRGVGRESLVFRTSITRSEVMAECQMSGKTLFQTAPGHEVVEEYRELAREIEERIDRSLGRVAAV